MLQLEPEYWLSRSPARTRDGDDDDTSISAGIAEEEFTAEGAASLLGISLRSDSPEPGQTSQTSGSGPQPVRLVPALSAAVPS